MVVQTVDHFLGPPLFKILIQLQLYNDLGHAADSQQHDGNAKEYQKGIEHPARMAERMHFGITHRADGDQGHVEGVEPGILFDDHEPHGPAQHNEQKRGRDQDQPVTKAMHAEVILVWWQAEDGAGQGEKLGDRHRCPRAVVVMWMIRDLGGLGQRSLSPSFSVA